ncbi:hypothetical protein ACIOWK_20190 [Pseudomonas protegens]|uniref:hypothetical protein n=1 Tax=Pseudomonas protegens TaxID=380021 RepID=UPI00382F5CC1
MSNTLDDALDIRCDFEKATILGDEDGISFALHDAFCIGNEAYWENSKIPGLFKSVPCLKKAWDSGWYTGQEDEQNKFLDSSE